MECSQQVDENICCTQVNSGKLDYYFQPETPGERRILTPENRKEEQLFLCTPQNNTTLSPLTKPPTLIRKRTRRPLLSTVQEEGEFDEEEEEISQRLKRVKVSEPILLPSFFMGNEFDREDWNEKVEQLDSTRKIRFGPCRGKKLGKGDFAQVYEIVDRMTGSVGSCAMKESRHMDGWRRRLFLKESQALAMVAGHPHILRYEANWFKPGGNQIEEQHVILTELCDANLQDATGVGDFPEQRLRRIVKHIASALVHIHDLGIVHMDVKPANILMSRCDLTGLETFKLADFGVATRIDGKGDKNRGTIRYMDQYHLGWSAEPEKVDVFSLGATICDVSSGKTVTTELTQECMETTWEETIPKDLTEEFRTLLKDMLATKREERPSAKEVLDRVTEM